MDTGISDMRLISSIRWASSSCSILSGKRSAKEWADLFQGALLFLFLSGTALVMRAAEPTEGEKLFALKVQPLFADKCLACHGGEAGKIKGEFDMTTLEDLSRGGEMFADQVLVPGQPEESILYKVVLRTEEDYEMPPKEADRLTEEQTWWIRDWIRAGAPWPDEERILFIQEQHGEGELVATSGGLSEDWTERRYAPQHLWAYRPLAVSSIPEGRHPVDHFIDRQLEATGLKPAPSATALEMVRRLKFGLTGLPPTPKEVGDFSKAYQQDPAAAMADWAGCWMATASHGEHFARLWLDVTRYADSAGFANDYSRPNAWRYRDYVVRSFMEDKPYDRFVMEQLAGDEMEDGGHEGVLATGFLRMGPWEQTAMSVFRVTRQQWLDDVTDSVGQTFLAHPLQCAKCHDHKFDPVPTRDYYSLMAVFTTTQFSEPDLPLLVEENTRGFEAADAWTKAKIEAYQKQRQDLQRQVEQKRRKENSEAKVGDNGLDPGDEASLARMSKNISRHTWELDKTRPIAFAVHTGKTIERKNVGNRLPRPDQPWAKGELEPDTILLGGDAYTRGDPVHPGPLSAAVNLGEMSEMEFPDGQGKRRLALARWLVDPGNPLTARVIVNRVWSWHFGRGIAGNPNNFGATGQPPTHPELLDALALRFMQEGWSIRKLNLWILTSEAYRRSSRHPDPGLLDQKDPKRESYAVFQPRRLSAEELRDAMLVVSGELNDEVGGVPCRPDINLEVAMQPRQIMGGTASVYEPDPLPEQRNRRTLYAEKIRGLRDPFLETFNQPGPDKSCELRETSTVAPQALTLLNAEEVRDRALAFAVRLLKKPADDATILKRAFRLALGRGPRSEELQKCLAHWEQATEAEAQVVLEATPRPSQITRTVMAEKTGEPYDFVEILPAYEDYVPDLQPSQVDARTRALGRVCVVLLNLNEFAYLD